jgi:hypothetical protein
MTMLCIPQSVLCQVIVRIAGYGGFHKQEPVMNTLEGNQNNNRFLSSQTWEVNWSSMKFPTAFSFKRFLSKMAGFLRSEKGQQFF